MKYVLMYCIGTTLKMVLQPEDQKDRSHRFSLLIYQKNIEKMTHIREGEMKMEKKSFFGSSMKTYYFKLRGQTLVYSKSSSSPIEGNFRIDHSSVKEWSKYPNGITLKTTNGETINLCTTSAFQFKRWIKALGT